MSMLSPFYKVKKLKSGITKWKLNSNFNTYCQCCHKKLDHDQAIVEELNDIITILCKKCRDIK